MDKSQAKDYLNSLIGNKLRITTTDTRMFLGQFKCTDSDRNIILAQTYEYRLPSAPKNLSQGKKPIVLDMSSRYLGLVVVPGNYIHKIEVEEFESQMRGRRTLVTRSSSASAEKEDKKSLEEKEAFEYALPR